MVSFQNRDVGGSKTANKNIIIISLLFCIVFFTILLTATTYSKTHNVSNQSLSTRILNETKNQASVSGSIKVSVTPLSMRVIPSTVIASSYLSSSLNAQGSPDEYVPLSFVVNSDQVLSNFIVIPSDLGSIQSSAIDIRTVKSWYVGSDDTDVFNKGRYLHPDLLLHNDSIVNVSGDLWSSSDISNPNGQNYFVLPNGSIVWVSDASKQYSSVLQIPINERPIQDAATLKPFNLPANYNKQFYVLIHIPSGQVSGTYTGTLKLQNGSTVLKTLSISLQVLPITLSQPDTTYSIFYNGMIHYAGTISSQDKNAEQFTAEQKDMKEHGISDPRLYFYSKDLLLQELSIRQQVGLNNSNLYSGSPVSNISQFKADSAQYGVKNIYVHSTDEANLNNSDARQFISTVHSNGGLFFNTQSYPSDALSVVDVLDLADVHGTFSPSLANTYHKYGHKVFSYGNPYPVDTDYTIHRLNNGLALWQSGYDGVMNYAYQAGFGDSWNCFDGNRYCDHSYTYPTANAPIDTIRWEAFRDGVTDVRYITTLQNLIAQKKAQGIDTTQAETYINSLKTKNLSNIDLDSTRSQTAAQIITLQQLGQKQKRNR